MKTLLPILGALLVTSCASLPPPAIVVATHETASPTDQGGRVGSPAIWSGGLVNEPGLVRSGFIASAARGDSLVIHDLEGRVIQRVAGAPVTDLDVAVLPLADSYALVVAAARRRSGQTSLVLFRLDRGADQEVRPWGEVATDLSRPAGLCMRQVRGVLTAVILDGRGQVLQFAVEEAPSGAPALRETRRFRVPNAGPGCAIDPGGRLFVSHRRRGFWSIPLDPSASPIPVHLVPGTPRNVPRSIGVAFLNDRQGPYLTSLDHDRKGFSVWRLERAGLNWAGRFSVLDGPGGPAVRSPGGIDALGGGMGSFPGGLVVVQDEANDGAPNLKYIDWTAVKEALGL
ncbi:MAG: phytase [Brevundimonas sp.]|uniref:phytase n=1 Tax=Brevundimonas sp. TaxID=1871086 RepID=UPI0026251336|nr:phytase [Brevundimonas sp.]MDI6625131.1 phytase [Brevundimonas sp.]MDQ7812594.1 phytase [Brevundimonas sp.]